MPTGCLVCARMRMSRNGVGVATALNGWKRRQGGKNSLASDGGNMGGVRVLWSLSQGQPPLDSEHC